METASSSRPQKQRRTQAGDSGAGSSTDKEQPELFVSEEPAQLEEFDEETQNAFDTLVMAMAHGMCVAYNAPFDELANAHSGGCGKELK